jgi:hypothetical protein
MKTGEFKWKEVNPMNEEFDSEVLIFCAEDIKGLKEYLNNNNGQSEFNNCLKALVSSSQNGNKLEFVATI